MDYFIISYNILVEWLLPVLLREPLQIKWLRVQVSQTKWLYDRFMEYRATNLYSLSINGQVCYLEKVLNDTFDPEVRGIYIDDITYPEYVWLFRDAELRPIWLYTDGEDEPMWLYTDAEVEAADSANVFVIHVPAAAVAAAGYSEARLRAIVDTYRLPCMSLYQVVIF